MTDFGSKKRKSVSSNKQDCDENTITNCDDNLIPAKKSKAAPQDSKTQTAAIAAAHWFESCSPADIVTMLTMHRFPGNSDENIQSRLLCFLEEAKNVVTEHFLTAGGAKSDDKDTEERKNDACQIGKLISSTNPENDCCDIMVVGPLKGLTPRGKFHLMTHERGIVLAKHNNNVVDSTPLVVPASCCSRILHFPLPAPQTSSGGSIGAWKPRKDVATILVMQVHRARDGRGDEDGGNDFGNGILNVKAKKKTKGANGDDIHLPYGKGTISCVVLELPPDNDGSKTGLTVRSIATALKNDVISPSPQGLPSAFHSSCEGHVGQPYIHCYSGVDSGILYPLKEGILFFKPMVFIPRKNIESITCGRGGSGTRYIDLLVTVTCKKSADDQETAEEVIEFTNILREELEGLTVYVKEVFQPSGVKVEKEKRKISGSNDNQSDEDIDFDSETDEDDADYHDGGSSDSTSDDEETEEGSEQSDEDDDDDSL